MHGLVREHAKQGKVSTGASKWRKEGSIPQYIDEAFRLYCVLRGNEAKRRRLADIDKQASLDERNRVRTRKVNAKGKVVVREAMHGNKRGAQIHPINQSDPLINPIKFSMLAVAHGGV